MKLSSRPAAMLMIGLGLGAIAGAYLHSGALWSGLALTMVGLGVAIASGPRAPVDPVDPAAPGERGHESERPALRGMGTKVEQILRLAEEQADDRRARATREAEQIVAEARAEARTIVEKARDQAT